jgi:16S rRNA (cytosine1402-N4)-methyltransferase
MGYKTGVNDQDDHSPEEFPHQQGLPDDLDSPDAPDIHPDATDGDSPDSGHLPVLVEPLREVLSLRPGLTMLDCTLGRGGHASIFAPLLAPGGRYIGLDVDPENLAYATQRVTSQLPEGVRFDAVRSNFAHAPQALASIGVEKVDILLADIGFASNQMDDPRRGFSFAADGPLDMRMDPDLPQSAADLVNHLPERELADLIYQLGEERLSRKIARKIVEERKREPIISTGKLANIVRHAYGPAGLRKSGKGQGRPIHPATRTFMALRIAVNGELEALDQLLADVPGLLNPQGIAAIISFHSLEDRRVKQSFLALQQAGKAERLTRKPLVASDEEMRTNPRSRSAKLRAIRLIEA